MPTLTNEGRNKMNQKGKVNTNGKPQDSKNIGGRDNRDEKQTATRSIYLERPSERPQVPPRFSVPKE
jgi:hypothetical protein